MELKDFYYFRKLAYSQVFLQSLDHLCVQVKIISNDYEDMIKNFFQKNKSVNFSNFKTAALVNKVIEISKKSSKLSKKINLY